MTPLCPTSAPPRSRPRKGRVLGALALTVLLGGAGCAEKNLTITPAEQQLLALFPLQATSQQRGAFVPPPVSAPAAPAQPPVTEAWMTEQLQKFDDRYAQSAADIKAVFEQAVATMKTAVTPADLKPLSAGIGKVASDLTGLGGRMESLISSLQRELRDLKQTLQDGGTKTAFTPNAPAGTADADMQAYLEGLRALQNTPRQTLPLRTWLDLHPTHPKASEALFQLGMSFFDSGFPSAGRYYFARLAEHYPASPQAAEAKAILGAPKPAPKRKPAPKPAANAEQTTPEGKTQSKAACDPKTVCGPSTDLTKTAPPAAEPPKSGPIPPAKEPAAPAKKPEAGEKTSAAPTPPPAPPGGGLLPHPVTNASAEGSKVSLDNLLKGK